MPVAPPSGAHRDTPAPSYQCPSEPRAGSLFKTLGFLTHCWSASCSWHPRLCLTVPESVSVRPSLPGSAFPSSLSVSESGVFPSSHACTSSCSLCPVLLLSGHNQTREYTSFLADFFVILPSSESQLSCPSLQALSCVGPDPTAHVSRGLGASELNFLQAERDPRPVAEAACGGPRVPACRHSVPAPGWGPERQGSVRGVSTLPSLPRADATCPLTGSCPATRPRRAARPRAPGSCRQ